MCAWMLGWLDVSMDELRHGHTWNPKPMNAWVQDSLTLHDLGRIPKFLKSEAWNSRWPYVPL